MKPLFILAMDHRDSFERVVYHVAGVPTPEEDGAFADGKKLVFDGLRAALTLFPTDQADAGVLVDEELGAAVARVAPDVGVVLAMPLEKSGQKIFELEYGEDWVRHLLVFHAKYAKVLVRDNPADDPADRALQAGRLAEVSAKLIEIGVPLLFELLIPATDEQLASVGGDVYRYDTEVRPGLTVDCIHYFQSQKVEPAIWKIEGLDTVEAAQSVVAAAREGGRDSVQCIVLGRDAPIERVDHWLQVAASVDGFNGFAVGRSIWQQPLVDHVAGKINDDTAIEIIGNNYLHFVRAYLG